MIVQLLIYYKKMVLGPYFEHMSFICLTEFSHLFFILWATVYYMLCIDRCLIFFDKIRN